MRKDPGPTFHKGQLVKAVRPTGDWMKGFSKDWDFVGWRRCTREETQAWYEKFHEDCHAGRDVWHDSAGEPKIAPNDYRIDLVEGRVYQVVRGRVQAPCGHRTVAGAVELLCTHTGQRFYTLRTKLTHLEE